jgi:multicomponent Na+:H+ antiporter subunit F
MSTDAIFVFIALLLLVSMAAGLVRVVIGPSPADRMMAAQLLGTSGIAILLAAVSVAAFTRRRVGQDQS